MIKKLRNCIMVASICLLACMATSIQAHEIIVKPILFKINPGQKLPFSVVSAHVFMVSEEMEPADQVEVFMVDSTGARPLTVKENLMLMTLDGQVTPEQEGTIILTAHRKGMIWTKTTQGLKQGSKKKLAGVLSSGKYEKFAKTIVSVEKHDDNYKKIVGHKLEIVPLSNPALARVGDDIAFQVLYEGRPLNAQVYATYDGFSDVEDTYAYFTQTHGNGTATVKITHPGTWMVRVEKTDHQPTDDYDNHVMRAVFAFHVD